jgi:hypothetical protein
MVSYLNVLDINYVCVFNAASSMSLLYCRKRREYDPLSISPPLWEAILQGDVYLQIGKDFRDE